VRVDRHFAFVDLSGFTAYTDRHGDDESVKVLTVFRAAVRQIATEFGVRIAKWLGDGCMLVAVEPAQLVAAVLELEVAVDALEEPLSVHAGLAGGPVILLEGDDYTGGPVNLASRLCDAAGADEILATPALADRAPSGAVLTSLGPVEVLGFHDPVEVVRVSCVAGRTAARGSGGRAAGR